MSIEEENKNIIDNFIDGINQNDQKILDECLADDFIRYAADGQQMDKKGYIEFGNNLKASFPDFYATINDMVAEKDKVAFRFTWTATNQSAAMNGALKGKQFKIIEDYFCRLEKGEIVEFKNLLDRLSWFEQAGITPPIGEGTK